MHMHDYVKLICIYDEPPQAWWQVFIKTKTYKKLVS